jgi:transcriptional regulator with XRE-family HTH domain
MNAARMVRIARRRARLTQRQLAAACGMPQPAVARIESGAVVPRVDTLDRLLEGCNESLEVMPRLGRGVDRTTIRRLITLNPGERFNIAVAEARNLDAITRGARH